jgi:hypothetical protein
MPNVPYVQFGYRVGSPNLALLRKVCATWLCVRHFLLLLTASMCLGLSIHETATSTHPHHDHTAHHHHEAETETPAPLDDMCACVLRIVTTAQWSPTPTLAIVLPQPTGLLTKVVLAAPFATEMPLRSRAPPTPLTLDR